MTRLWIPETAREREATCNLCGVTLPYEAAEAHMVRCAREHMDEIQAARPSVRHDIFSDQSWDPEIAAHMRTVGERMKAEGRLVVKPNERAGFS